MTMEKVLKDLREKPVVPLWPHLGIILGVARGSVYSAVGREEFRKEFGVFRVLNKYKVLSATVRQRLHIEGPSSSGTSA